MQSTISLWLIPFSLSWSTMFDTINILTLMIGPIDTIMLHSWYHHDPSHPYCHDQSILLLSYDRSNLYYHDPICTFIIMINLYPHDRSSLSIRSIANPIMMVWSVYYEWWDDTVFVDRGVMMMRFARHEDLHNLYFMIKSMYHDHAAMCPLWATRLSDAIAVMIAPSEECQWMVIVVTMVHDWYKWCYCCCNICNTCLTICGRCNRDGVMDSTDHYTMDNTISSLWIINGTNHVPYLAWSKYVHHMSE